jgi:hypothetical protein
MLHFCKEIYTEIHTMVASMLHRPLRQQGKKRARGAYFCEHANVILQNYDDKNIGTRSLIRHLE